jgi:cytidylate kinase
MRRRSLIIAIDGPAGAGKTTAARNLARRLRYTYLDTGATFRAVALKATRQRVDTDDPVATAEVAQFAEIKFGGDEQERIFLDDEDITNLIRNQAISNTASKISAYPEVRRILTEMWRKIGKDGGVVLEGRDIGTVVFPDAELKVFLVAEPRIRAERRYKELEHPAGMTLEQLAGEIARRDAADSSRLHAPLTRAADAIEVDTSHLNIEQTADCLARLAHRRAEELGQPQRKHKSGRK